MITWIAESSREVRVACERLTRVKGIRPVIRRAVLRGILICNEIDRMDCRWAVEYRLGVIIIWITSCKKCHANEEFSVILA